MMLESTGLYGESVMHLLDPSDFRVIKSVSLGDKYFGEGADWIKNKNGDKEIH